MTWEETIQFIQDKEEFYQLIEDTYITRDLKQNVLRYGFSEEFKEIQKIINKFFGNKRISIADIGSGNGITSINFALMGYDVIAIEPDESESVGSKAIEFLKNEYSLNNIKILKEFGEKVSLKNESVDFSFARQAMHHAYNLNDFVKEGARILKTTGLFFTVRDHVIFDVGDRQKFLNNHPLHKFYGGENAFTIEEYLGAFKNAGLKVLKVIKHFESPINYAPIKRQDLPSLPKKKEKEHLLYFQKKFPWLSKMPGAFSLYKLKAGFAEKKVLNEKCIPGRMYSFIAQKV